ncbi:MAG: META domain-containing protein [Actinobacteria bacterium]|nr:META domain-containing protein [Actinomycetota bacterium]
MTNIAFLAIALLGCGSRATPSEPADAKRLTGRWGLEAVLIDGQPMELDTTLDTGDHSSVALWIEFYADGRIDGEGPCNGFRGSYSATQGVLSLEDATKEAGYCLPLLEADEEAGESSSPDMVFESAFLDRLLWRWEIAYRFPEDDLLELSASNTTMTFRRLVTPPSTTTGRSTTTLATDTPSMTATTPTGPESVDLLGRWGLDAVFVGGQPYALDESLATRYDPDVPTWIEFDPRGRLVGQGPCNRFNSKYSAENGVLSLTGGGTQPAFCLVGAVGTDMDDSSNPIMDFEEEILAGFLRVEVGTFRFVEASRLEVTMGDITLTFRRIEG